MKFLKQLFFFIILSVLIFLIYCLLQFPIVESMENINIPKKIWTFWDNEELPKVIEKCIQTWKTHNPDFEIIILNKYNVRNYLPEFPVNDLKHADDVRHFSDIVRVHILAKYGGIWSDASIICYGSYDWIFDLQQSKQSEFIGYWINNDDSDSPIIENWFFACVPNSTMVNDWKDSLMESQNFEKKEEYIDYLKSTCNLEHISDPGYLWMHAALQKILQENKGKYRYEIFSAHDGPFKFASENNWDVNSSLIALEECKKNSNCMKKYNSFIKLTGLFRGSINDSNVDEIL